MSSIDQEYLADLRGVCKYYDHEWMPEFAKKLEITEQSKFRFKLLAGSQADFVFDTEEQERIKKLAPEDPTTEVAARNFLYSRLREYVQPSDYFAPLWEAKIELSAEELAMPWNSEHPLMKDGLNLLPRGLLLELNQTVDMFIYTGGKVILGKLAEGEYSVEVAAPKS